MVMPWRQHHKHYSGIIINISLLSGLLPKRSPTKSLKNVWVRVLQTGCICKICIQHDKYSMNSALRYAVIENWPGSNVVSATAGRTVDPGRLHNTSHVSPASVPLYCQTLQYNSTQTAQNPPRPKYDLVFKQTDENGNGGCRFQQHTGALTAKMGRLSQWLRHDDSTVNVIQVLLLSLVIITIIRPCSKRSPKKSLRMYELEFLILIRMSAGSLPKCIGFNLLSVSVISPSIVKIGRWLCAKC